MAPFGPQIRRGRTGQFYDLVIEACCPRCGWELSDGDFLDRVPSLDGWDRTSRARCEHCGCVYHVRFDLEDEQRPLGQLSPYPPGASWFASMRRR